MPPISETERSNSGVDGQSEFEKESRDTPHPPLWLEFLQYLRETGQWWLLPILLCCGVLSLIAWAAGTAVAPFIYTLF